MSIDQTQVFQACDALASRALENQALTLAAVREALGSRGSFSTLAPLVRAWKDARHAARQSTPVPLPEGLGAHSARMLDSLWSSALVSARAEAARAREGELAGERAAQTETLGELARLEAETTRLREEHAAAIAAAETERKAAQDLRTALGAATERATQALARAAEEQATREALASQLAAAREEAAELRGTLKALRKV